MGKDGYFAISPSILLDGFHLAGSRQFENGLGGNLAMITNRGKRGGVEIVRSCAAADAGHVSD
jgi:hypothetical protein